MALLVASLLLLLLLLQQHRQSLATLVPIYFKVVHPTHEKVLFFSTVYPQKKEPVLPPGRTAFFFERGETPFIAFMERGMSTTIIYHESYMLSDKQISWSLVGNEVSLIGAKECLNEAGKIAFGANPRIRTDGLEKTYLPSSHVFKAILDSYLKEMPPGGHDLATTLSTLRPPSQLQTASSLMTSQQINRQPQQALVISQQQIRLQQEQIIITFQVPPVCEKVLFFSSAVPHKRESFLPAGWMQVPFERGEKPFIAFMEKGMSTTIIYHESYMHPDTQISWSLVRNEVSLIGATECLNEAGINAFGADPRIRTDGQVKTYLPSFDVFKAIMDSYLKEMPPGGHDLATTLSTLRPPSQLQTASSLMTSQQIKHERQQALAISQQQIKSQQEQIIMSRKAYDLWQQIWAMNLRSNGKEPLTESEKEYLASLEELAEVKRKLVQQP